MAKRELDENDLVYIAIYKKIVSTITGKHEDKVSCVGRLNDLIGYAFSSRDDDFYVYDDLFFSVDEDLDSEVLQCNLRLRAVTVTLKGDKLLIKDVFKRDSELLLGDPDVFDKIRQLVEQYSAYATVLYRAASGAVNNQIDLLRYVERSKEP